MAKLLEMKNITKKFGEVVALNNISISLETGEILSLCGENGSAQINSDESIMWNLSCR